MMAKKTKPIVCYSRAPSVEMAQQCAWDVSWAPEIPDEARPFGLHATRPRTRLYQVTITAKPIAWGKARAAARKAR